MFRPIIERNSSGQIVRATVQRWVNTHAHARWDNRFNAAVPDIIRHCKYVLFMPNDGPDNGRIETIEGATRVYHRIMDLRAQKEMWKFRAPILTLNHTTAITPHVIERIAMSHFVKAVKNYPVHTAKVQGTTGSGSHGVPFDKSPEVIRAMIEYKVPLLIHAEDAEDENGNEIPYPDRSRHCYHHRLRRFREENPDLIIHIEHADIKEIVELVKEDTTGRTTCGITSHHLRCNDKDFSKPWRNDLRCMPYVKTEEDQQVLLDFAVSGDERCDAGDDYAPHPWRKTKHPSIPFEKAACGATLPHSLPMYFAAFNERNALDERFTAFMTRGAKRYGLPMPEADDTIVIRAEEEKDIPDPTPILNESGKEEDILVPLGWMEDMSHPERMRIGYAVS